MNKKNIEEFEYAIKLKKEGKLEEAKKYFIKAADLGCSDAFIELGQLEVPDAGENYYNYSKLDVTLLPMPYHIAEFKWYEKASELGNLKGLLYVGIAHKQGYVVNQNYDAAYNCFAKAVELGDDFAASYYLAECYELGLGVEKDENSAVMYYAMGAEIGNIKSMLALARIYNDGLGSIKPDKEKSTKYFFMSGVGRD